MSSDCHKGLGNMHTSFIITKCSGDSLYKFDVKPVENFKGKLIQQPNESFTLSFHPKKNCVIKQFHNELEDKEAHLKDPCHVHTFDLNLTFDNDFHGITPNCYYEIILSALVREKGLLHHRQLFSYKKNRKTDQINLPFQVLYFSELEDLKLVHICISLQRFCGYNNRSSSACIRKEERCLKKFLFSKVMRRDASNDDVLILATETDQFHAHKSILSAKSSVFRVMFMHDMSENRENRVKIDGYEPEIVYEMLNYIYTDTVQNMSKNVYGLFKIAHQYEIPELSWKCEEYLILNINRYTFLDTMRIVEQYEPEKLKKCVLAFLNSRVEKSYRDNGDLLKELSASLDASTVAYILKYCVKYDLKELKLKVFDYILSHKAVVAENEEFMSLYETNADLMKELFKYSSTK